MPSVPALGRPFPPGCCSKGTLRCQGPGAGPSEGRLSAQNSRLQSRTFEPVHLSPIMKSLLQRQAGAAEGRMPTPTGGAPAHWGRTMHSQRFLPRVPLQGAPRLTPHRFQSSQTPFNGCLSSAAQLSLLGSSGPEWFSLPRRPSAPPSPWCHLR